MLERSRGTAAGWYSDAKSLLCAQKKKDLQQKFDLDNIIECVLV